MLLQIHEVGGVAIEEMSEAHAHTRLFIDH